MIPPRPNDNTSAAAQGAIGESSPVAAPRFAPRTPLLLSVVPFSVGTAAGSRLAPRTAGTDASGVAASSIVVPPLLSLLLLLLFFSFSSFSLLFYN